MDDGVENGLAELDPKEGSFSAPTACGVCLFLSLLENPKPFLPSPVLRTLLCFWFLH